MNVVCKGEPDNHCLKYFNDFLFPGNLIEDDGSRAPPDKGYFVFRPEDVHNHMKKTMTMEQLSNLEKMLQLRAIQSGFARKSSKTMFSFIKASYRHIIKSSLQSYSNGTGNDNRNDDKPFSNTITRKRKGFRREPRLFSKAAFFGRANALKQEKDTFPT